jgi:hypothetical protein
LNQVIRPEPETMRAAISIPQRRASAIQKGLIGLARRELHPNVDERADILRDFIGDDRVLKSIIERGVAPLGTTSATGFVEELTQHPVAEFLATLAPLSAAAAIMAQGLQVPLAGAASMKFPGRTGAASTEVAWIGEGGAIPVRGYTLNDDTLLSPKKHGFIIAISREAARRSGGEAVIRTLIREDAAASFDEATLSDEAGDATIHAGLLGGVAALPGYPGGDREAAETDLVALSDAVSAGGSGQLMFVVSPRRANRVRIKFPDLARALAFLPSLAVADGDIVAVDPVSVAWGFADDVQIDVAKETILHMENEAPAVDIGDNAAPVQSMFQIDAIAIRFVSDIAFSPRRPNAVAWMQGLTW